jgi:hypothetical protein
MFKSTVRPAISEESAPLPLRLQGYGATFAALVGRGAVATETSRGEAGAYRLYEIHAPAARAP